MLPGQTSVAPAPLAAGRERVARRRRAWPFVVLAVAVLFAVTYALAWSRAEALSATYLKNADDSYNQHNYLQALIGGQKFDLNTNSYVTIGGYMQVEQIWQNHYAWPRPAGVERAQQRVDEIINKDLTISQAEQFVQQNAGKQNPYFGVIYLRLGELYAQKGDAANARSVFESIPQMFPGQPVLIKQAQADLARLPGK